MLYLIRVRFSWKYEVFLSEENTGEKEGKERNRNDRRSRKIRERGRGERENKGKWEGTKYERWIEFDPFTKFWIRSLYRVFSLHT